MAPRVFGTSKTQEIVPEVKLISSSSNPEGVIASMWIGCRYNRTIQPQLLQYLYEHPVNNGETSEFLYGELMTLYEYYPEYAGLDSRTLIKKLVQMVDETNLPPLDAINFTFQLDDVTVAFREQLVRSRLPQNFWTQTSRTADLTKMDVSMLSTIEGEEAQREYREVVDQIRQAYIKLQDLGVPSEDIRLMPSNMTHRIYWMVPYRTLKSVLCKRLSWIAQSTLWTPIIKGILTELRENGQQTFADFIGTPSDVTIKDGKVVAHRYENENLDRYYDRDSQPCDPLWLAYHEYKPQKGLNADQMKMYYEMKDRYIDVWSDKILEILGWSRTNRDQLGRFDPR